MICDNLCFIHVVVGYFNTSEPFELGKGLAGKKMKNSVLFYEQAMDSVTVW